MKSKIKIKRAGSNGTYLYAFLSNGASVIKKTAYCDEVAYAQLVADIGYITGQTDRGVKQSLRNKWIF
jgi:hypothetical protein